MTVKIILVSVIFLNVLLGIFVFSQNPKSLSSRLFSILAFLGAVWSLINYMIGLSHSIYWFLSTYAVGSFVISVGLIWTIVITKKKVEFEEACIICCLSVFFFITSYIPGFLVHWSAKNNLAGATVSTYGWGLYLYSIYYISFAFLIAWKLYKAQRNATEKTERSQIRLIFFGSIITLLCTAFTTFIMPFVEISLSGIVDSIGFLIFLSFIAYSITRHHLFNIKVIAIELVTFCLWTIIFIRIIMANTQQERLFECGLLIIMIIFGIMLIRSTLHDVKQREYIDKLSRDLKDTYELLKRRE